MRQCRRESQRLLLMMMMMMTSMVMMQRRRRRRHRCERMLLLQIGALRGGTARGRTQKAARECYFIMRGLREKVQTHGRSVRAARYCGGV